LRKENCCAIPTSDFSCGRNKSIFGSRHCAAALFTQVPKQCTDLDLINLFYILASETYKLTTDELFCLCNDDFNEIPNWKYLVKWFSLRLQGAVLGLGITRTNTDSKSRGQFTTNFINFFVPDTKQFVGSTVNVILTWKTCDQRSSSAESKHRAFEKCFSE